MIELPNDKWLRNPKMPEYAICFDQEHAFFLWKMVENEAYGTWTSVAALTPEELVKILAMKDPLLDPYRNVIGLKLAALHAQATRLQGDGGVLEGTNRTTSGAIGQP